MECLLFCLGFVPVNEWPRTRNRSVKAAASVKPFDRFAFFDHCDNAPATNFSSRGIFLVGCVCAYLMATFHSIFCRPTKNDARYSVERVGNRRRSERHRNKKTQQTINKKKRRAILQLTGCYPFAGEGGGRKKPVSKTEPIRNSTKNDFKKNSRRPF